MALVGRAVALAPDDQRRRGALRQEAHVLAELVREGEILKRNAVDRILNAGVAFGVADSVIYEILNSEFPEFNRDFMDTQRSEYPTLCCAASPT
jgi:hypothetical protein